MLLLQQSIMVLLAPEDVFRVSACSHTLSRVWDAHLLPQLHWRLPRHYPVVRREGLLAHPDLSLTWPENWPEDWRGMQFDPWILAATHGDVELLQFLEDRGTQHCLVHTMDMAACRGHLPAVIWLHQHRTGCTKYAMDFAMVEGHLHIVKWLHENRTEGGTIHAMNVAKENGQSHVIEWLQNHPVVLR